MADREYLDGMCNYKGNGSDLPSGGFSAIPGWGPERIMYRWVVDCSEELEGVKQVSTTELKKMDNPIIYGGIINKNTLEFIIGDSPYKENFFKIKDANGKELNLDQWYSTYHTNGMVLVAIRNMRAILKGKHNTVDIDDLTRRKAK